MRERGDGFGVRGDILVPVVIEKDCHHDTTMNLTEFSELFKFKLLFRKRPDNLRCVVVVMHFQSVLASLSVFS